MNTKGELIPGVAKEWGTEDNGKTWTFKLRDDATWVDYQGNEMAKLTAMASLQDSLQQMCNHLVLKCLSCQETPEYQYSSLSLHQDL